MTATKLSILFFYHRVFGTQRGFRIANITVGILCLMWWIGVTLVGCLRCSPVAAQWDPTIPNPNCIALSKILITGETPNSLLDFIIIALPIGVIKNLHLPLQQKINIGFICVLVAFVGVIGFIRIAITFRPVGTHLISFSRSPFYSSLVYRDIVLTAPSNSRPRTVWPMAQYPVHVRHRLLLPSRIPSLASQP